MTSSSFFKAELEGRVVAVVHVDGDGGAFRLGASHGAWEAAPELARLVEGRPGDRIYWEPIAEAEARALAESMGAPLP